MYCYMAVGEGGGVDTGTLLKESSRLPRRLHCSDRVASTRCSTALASFLRVSSFRNVSGFSPSWIWFWNNPVVELAPMVRSIGSPGGYGCDVVVGMYSFDVLAVKSMGRFWVAGRSVGISTSMLLFGGRRLAMCRVGISG